jgi:YHS domain-containing protein
MEGILWLLVWAAFFYFMMRFGCGAHMVHGHGGHGSEKGPMSHGAAGGSRDPVCGMNVASDSGYSRIYQGKEYRFCSRNCLDQFDSDPVRFAK